MRQVAGMFGKEIRIELIEARYLRPSIAISARVIAVMPCKLSSGYAAVDMDTYADRHL